jgi:hypothetical protein
MFRALIDEDQEIVEVNIEGAPPSVGEERSADRDAGDAKDLR